jgi:hypothetical protein
MKAKDCISPGANSSNCTVVFDSGDGRAGPKSGEDDKPAVAQSSSASSRTKQPLEDWMVLLPLSMLGPIVDHLTASWSDWAYYGAQAGTILIGPGKGTAATRGAVAADANKLGHIFGQARHNLGPLVQKLGSQEAAFTAVQSAAQSAVRSQRLSGVFQTTVNVAGQNVVVRGNVIDGVARIGTFFVP